MAKAPDETKFNDVEAITHDPMKTNAVSVEECMYAVLSLVLAESIAVE